MTSQPDSAYEPAKLAPHSQDAEEAVLGSILINPEAYLDVAEFLKEEDFFILRNSWIFGAMQRLHSREGAMIEYLTVIEELRVQGRLDEIGGAAYITYLASSVGTSVHAETYGRIVERAAIRRKLLEAASEIIRLACEEDADITKVIAQCEKALFDATERGLTEPLRPATDDVLTLFQKIDDLGSGKVKPQVTKTYTKLDNYLTGQGMEPGAVIVSSDTSGGKSQFVNYLMGNIALAKLNVATFTLEMTREAVLRRMLARFSGVTTDNLAIGKIQEGQKQRYQEAKSTLLALSPQLLIDETMMINIHQIMAKIRRARRDYDIAAAFVDYAGLIDDAETDDEKRYKVVGSFIRMLHQLGLKLRIPIIIGAQQNRKGGGVKGIAESYEIAQHSQTFFYIEDDEFQPHAEQGIKYKNMIIAKQRDGWGGISVPFRFDHTTQTITDEFEKTYSTPSTIAEKVEQAKKRIADTNLEKAEVPKENTESKQLVIDL